MMILLMGPQGAGKGTQGERLAEQLGYPLIGAGALLRDEIATASELGVRLRAIMDAGELVSPDIITDILQRRLQQPDAAAGVVIDGYPRDPEQLRLMFERFVPEMVIVLDLDDQTAVDRLGGRWMCPQGHIYNEQTRPPQTTGVCDEDGEALFQRSDDTETAIRKRLQIYHADTAPLIAEMQTHGIQIEHVDASRSIEDVWEDVSALVR